MEVKYQKHPRSDEVKDSYIKRLNKINGQVKGINKMIENDRYCGDILIQISAVNKAIQSLGKEILNNHMRTCVIEEIENKNYGIIDEVLDLTGRLN